MRGNLLIVEDEVSITSFLQTSLEREGFSVRIAPSGEDAINQVETQQPDLILLDIMLPGMDGLEVCQMIRKRKDYIPIIMLTAKDDEIDKIVGLEIGADDYIAKPFNSHELIARVRAVLRLVRRGRDTDETDDRLVIDDRLQIDLAGRVASVDGEHVDLTPKEFDLLALMGQNRGRVFGRDTLLERVWGYDYLGDSRTVDVHIQRLRSKIEPDKEEPRYILTVRTIGYKFSEKL
jgi:two-component system alkaline phosphatase synthesis response regulator PhoP